MHGPERSSPADAALAALNEPGPHALALNIVAAVGAASLLNGLIFVFGWNTEREPASEPSFALPGVVVGYVWMILLALMAGARWQLCRVAAGAPGAAAAAAPAARVQVTTLIALCLAWPLYSLGPRSTVAGLIGCLVTLGWAIRTVAGSWKVSPPAAALIAPVVLWLLLAAAVLFAMVVAV